jgi:hypothetical protein
MPVVPQRDRELWRRARPPDMSTEEEARFPKRISFCVEETSSAFGILTNQRRGLK